MTAPPRSSSWATRTTPTPASPCSSPSSSSSSGPASTSSTSPWSATGAATRRSAPSRAARRTGVALPDPADVPGRRRVRRPGPLARCARAATSRAWSRPSPWRCLGVARAVESRSRMPRARRRSAAAWRAVLDRGRAGAAGPRTAGPWPTRARPGRHPLARRADRLAGADRAAERLDRPEVVALLRSALPTWGGMGSASPSGRPVGPWGGVRGSDGRSVTPMRRGTRRPAPTAAGAVPVGPRRVPRRGRRGVHRGGPRRLGRGRRCDRAGGRRPGAAAGQPGYRLAELLEHLVDDGAAAAAGHGPGASGEPLGEVG